MVVEDALETCLGIAEALEAAHEKGIIHRDLKPANVKFTSDGKVKVLDFGLAKPLDAEPETMTSTGPLADSPTITADYTKPGTILGTAGYMSPEQARGKGLDKRTDIWSFGCVLYECLTGKRPFQGEDVTETLASIIKGEPDWGSLPRNTPPAIQLLLRKCLTKDRKRRLQDIGDARVDLADAIEDPSSTMIRLSEGALAGRGLGRSISWMRWAIGMVVACLITGTLVWNLRPIPEAPAVKPLATKRAEILIVGESPLDSTTNNALALSRDGKSLVYNLFDAGAGLRVRDLGTGEDKFLLGTELDFGVESSPFFSWDGNEVGMVLDGNLVRLPISGGTPQALVEGVRRRGFQGGSWGEDGSIVYAEDNSPMKLVSEKGGEVRTLTELGDDHAHGLPQILPGGGHVLFIAVKRVDGNYVGRAEVLNLVTERRKEVEIGECQDVRYVSSGHLLYAKGNEVFAIGWDSESLEVIGKGKRVLEGVRQDGSWKLHFEVSEEGTLIYEAELKDGGGRSLVWVEATEEGIGKKERFTERSGEWDRFALSPDEQKVAIQNDGDLYIIEQVSEGFDQLRLFVTKATDPVWSKDGEWIYYQAATGDFSEIWKKKAEFRADRGEMVYAHEEGFRVSPESVSADYLIISRQGGGGDYDIVRVDLKRELEEAEVMYGEAYVESWGQISPKGEWLTYYTKEFGNEIYVAPMDGSREGQMVSNGGGLRPRWSGSGKEIYYQWGRSIYSVKVIGGGGQLVREEPKELFEFSFDIHRFQWTISREGERFLMLVNLADLEDATDESDNSTPEPAHLKLVTNWFTELNELVPLDEE